MKVKTFFIIIFSIILLTFPVIVLGTYDETNIVPQNDIPLVIIRIDESEETIQAAIEDDPEHEYGNIEDMNSSKHHTTRCVGTIEIVLPDGYESEYDLSNHPTGEQKLSYIRGRGNSTWMISSKKPYKIKYDKKQDVLGMGKNKEWALLANSFDPTLTHNAIMSWFGEEMVMEFTPKMLPVDVVMIGSESGTTYLGSYYLAELTDIGNNRIEIPELDENETENITGGYLLSLYYYDQDFKEPENTVFETEYSKIKFINENPYFDEGELTQGQELQRTYIRDYVNQIDNLIMNNDIIDENIHNQIAELMDLKSTADFWLMQEFFVNFDGYKTSSNYLYKKENGKLYWGPLWDFDLMLYMVDADELVQATGFNRSLPFKWLDRLRSNDPLFVELLKSEWEVMNEKLIELTKEDGVLNQLKERQRKAWDANYELWKEANYYGNETSIDEEFEKLYRIVDYRRNWFNDNIDNIGKVYSTVTYEIDGEIVKTETVRTESLLETIDLKPQKDGLLFDGWADKETNEKVEEYAIILKDITLVPRFVSSEEIKEKIDFYFSGYDVWVALEEGEYSRNSIKIFPDDHYELITNNIIWTSSNEDVATVENDSVILHSIGETTITATLFDGTTKSYVLHVYGEEQEFNDDPQEVVFDKESYTLEVGETAQIVYNYNSDKPVNPNVYMDVSCEIDDESIVERDYLDFYVIKGLKEGETYVTITIFNNDTRTTITTKKIKVTVVSKKDNTDEDTTLDEPEEPKPEITYEFIEGANQKYTIGDNGATFKIDAEYSLFENGGKVYVDDKLVSAENYTSKSGSTVITFTKNFMNSLSVGEHSLKVVFNNDAIATTKFTVAKANTTSEGSTSTGTNTTKTSTTSDTNTAIKLNTSSTNITSKGTNLTNGNVGTTGTEKTKNTTSETPKTGDNIVVWIILMIVSTLVFLGTIILPKIWKAKQ